MYNNLKFLIQAFYKFKYINFILMIMLFSVFVVSSYVFGYFSIINKADVYLSDNKSIYSNLFSIKRSSEMKNYNFNKIYTSDELENNISMFKFISDEFDVYVAFSQISKPEESYLNGSLVDFIYCNNNFSDSVLSNYIQNGESFNSYDFSKGKYIPLVLGNGFSHAYKVGEVLDNKYIVKGILDERAYFYDFNFNYYSMNTDFMIFKPIILEEIDSLNYSFLVTNSKIYTEERIDLEKINDYADKIFMDTFVFTSQNEQFSLLKEDDITLLTNEIFILVNLCVILLFMILIIQELKFWSRSRDYILYMISGSTPCNLLIIELFEILIIIISTLLLMLIANLFILKIEISMSIILFMVSVVIVCTLLSIFISYRNISKL